jgi:hypothetical protein
LWVSGGPDEGSFNYVLLVTSSDDGKSWSEPKPDSPKNHIPHLTSAQWREDLHALATGIARRHKNAFQFTAKAKFEAAVAALDNQIPSLKSYQVLVGMMRILAIVGDGHTRSDDLFNSFSQFPVDLYWFDGQLRVIRTTPQYRQALGGRVVAIDSMAIADADRKVGSIIEQHETEGWVKRFSAFYLACPEILEYFGIINNLGRASYTISRKMEMCSKSPSVLWAMTHSPSTSTLRLGYRSVGNTRTECGSPTSPMRI